MIIKDNMANMCAKVTSTYMEFTLAFGPKPEFSFSFKYTFTNLNCVRISFPDDTNNNYIVSVTLYIVCANIKALYIVYPEKKITIYRGSMDMENIIS